MKMYEPLNPYMVGIARTIKATYQKQGPANFIRKGSMGATGVIEYEQNNTDRERAKHVTRQPHARPCIFR